MPAHRFLAPSPDTVHWGYFDATIPPRLTLDSGDTVTVDTVSGGLVEEAYVFCSLACDLRVTQLVDGNKGIHAMVSRDLVD